MVRVRGAAEFEVRFRAWVRGRVKIKPGPDVSFIRVKIRVRPM